ncbi:hypothetical protein PS15m_012358 [Mucor circinelloides]
MKLRDRQKRVSNDIKQEDKKVVINLIDTPSSALNESNAYNSNIKQEDTKNDNSLLQQDEGRGYFYRCDVCKKRMPNLKSVLQHRKSIHNVKPSSHRIIKDVHTEPDIYDPNFYCKTCKMYYNSKLKYKAHLRTAHFMVLKAKSKYEVPQNAILPDPDDPNQYCRACDYTYSGKSHYKQHCRYKHGMTSVQFGFTKSKTDGIVDTYCKICGVRLSSKQNYKQHLLVIHNVDWRLIHPKPKNIMPDVDDPNFYCRVCQRKSKNKRIFRAHLMNVHALYQSAPKKTILEPDTDDPNNNCRACQKNYSTKNSYRNHIRHVHQIALPLLRRNDNLRSLPNPNDPHHYCSVCKRSWMKRTEYRSHCKKVHFMALDHHRISNPNAMIDINHPEHYCAQCEYLYSA